MRVYRAEWIDESYLSPNGLFMVRARRSADCTDSVRLGLTRKSVEVAVAFMGLLVGSDERTDRVAPYSSVGGREGADRR